MDENTSFSNQSADVFLYQNEHNTFKMKEFRKTEHKSRTMAD